MNQANFTVESNKQELQSMLDALNRSQAIIEFNMDGTIITANEIFLNVMGYTLDEIRGKHHSIFVEPGYGTSIEYEQFWKNLNQGTYQSAEYKRIDKHGKEVWIQASYNPILNEHGTPYKVVKYATDVTTQKLIAADFSGQIEAISKAQAVIEFNLDGTIITANDNFLDTMGYSLEEIQGKHHSIFVEPAYKQSVEYTQFWEKLSQGEYQSAEYKRLGKYDKEVWIQASYNPIRDLNGKPYKIVKFATDITRQKLITADFSGQIQAIHKAQAVIEFNMDGTIITANDNFLNTMGYSLEEIQGKHHSMFVEPADKQNAEYKQFWNRLNQGEYQSAEYKRIGKLSKAVWIQASYNPILDLNGKPFKVVKFATDVTKQKLVAADFSGQIQAIGKAQAVIEFNMDGTIITANDNFLNTMGYSLSEIQGKHHRMFVEDTLQHSADYKRFWESLNNGEYQSAEYKRIGKYAKEVWIQATYNPIFDLNRKPIKVVKYATDVTSRKTAINEIKQLLIAVSEGDLSNLLENEFEGDFKILGDSINALVENLISMISEIRNTASSISDASSEISKGNEDLSKRTDQQAASLEETASTMDEMTSIVRKNSENAQQAAKLAAETKTQAEAGGEIINNVIHAMADINSSSRNIADIIGTIDEIAFQTNLLALNAAVEAARAGEQGKGFAVVAAEVRNLAQRSAGAAKEIKLLINDSVEKIHDGSKLVDKSGKTLDEIVVAVIKVNDLMSEIAEAVQEQSTGIEQINQTVSQLDNSTQQNAALVEEATAAAREMESQALTLDEIMNEFIIEKSNTNHSRDKKHIEPETVKKQKQTRSTKRRRTTKSM